MGDEKNESFYAGGVSSFNPDYSLSGSFLGYRLSPSQISSTTSVQTANQLKEVVQRIKEGVKNVELQPLGEGVIDTIPKQQFAEIKALMRLSGVNPSMHSPIIDPAGFEQNGFSEENRLQAERKLFSVLEKARELDFNGNIPVVIHSTGAVRGDEYSPGDEEKGEQRWHRKSMGVFDREKKQIAGIIPEEKEFKPEMTAEEYAQGGKKTNAEEMITSINSRQWIKEKQNVNYYMDLMNQAKESIPGTMGSMNSENKEEEKSFGQILNRTERYIETNKDHIDGMWNTIGKYGSEQQKEELKRISNDYRDKIKELEEQQKKVLDEQSNKKIVIERAQFVEDLYEELNKITSGYDPHKKNKVVTADTEKIWGAPSTLVGAEEFAREKTAETIGSVAWKSYKELGGEKAPMLAIENMYQGMAFSRAEDMQKVIDKSREIFVKNAIKGGMDKKDAESAAEKLIGVTWDVGHLNLFKKEGFTDKDLIEQTKTIAPYVKHVHLTDNFGYSDTHLAPGMGNVPFKEILKELEKTGRLDEMRKVIEGGGLTNPNMGLTMSPFKASLGAFGSQIYGGGAYWNQVAGIANGGGYFGGQGNILPDKHFSMYGSGFSSLPTELGGQMPGNTSRSTGTPMA
jgi:sugar phosphate isomerase/epimerase